MSEWDGVGDPQLMEAIRAANHRAFQELMVRYSRKCYRLCYRILGDRQMAEDVVQETMLKLWLRPFMWQPDRGVKFSTWLYRVVSNGAIDSYRKNRSRMTMPIEEEYLPAIEMNYSASDWERLGQIVKVAINSLPPKQRLAIILCRLEKMRHKEVAELMEVSPKAVEKYISRGIRGLKTRLKKRGINIEELLE